MICILNWSLLLPYSFWRCLVHGLIRLWLSFMWWCRNLNMMLLSASFSFLSPLGIWFSMAAVWDGAFCVCFLPSVYLRLFANSLIWIFATALSASVQRSLFMLATSMLLFAAKIYQITELAAFLKLSIPVDVSLCYYSLIRYPTNIHSEACVTYCVGKCELCLMVFDLLV